MLSYIEFKYDDIDKTKERNVLCGNDDLTDNTIIICNNANLMDKLATEIINTVNGKAEYNDYWCEEKDIGTATIDLSFGLQRIIVIGNQKITLGLEPSLVYKANDISEIFLFDYVGTKEYGSYKEFIIWASVFKGSREAWEQSKDETYKLIVSGRYGCYDGKWIK